MVRRLISRCIRWASTLLVLVALVTNWYVHQPRYWQQVQAQHLPPPLAKWAARIGNASADLTDALGLTGRDVEVAYPATLPTNMVTCAGVPKRIGEPAPSDIAILRKTDSWSATRPRCGIRCGPPTARLPGGDARRTAAPASGFQARPASQTLAASQRIYQERLRPWLHGAQPRHRLLFRKDGASLRPF